jgi:hypothetical protein
MSLLQRLVGALLGVLFLLAILVFASIALAVILAMGLATWGWLWWRSRSAPRRTIIEGEYRDVTQVERLEDREREPL